jgi:hypothetical protein
MAYSTVGVLSRQLVAVTEDNHGNLSHLPDRRSKLALPGQKSEVLTPVSAGANITVMQNLRRFAS